ncbi:hypothetical protein EJB05_37028, partial [Eragrostis curvula]
MAMRSAAVEMGGEDRISALPDDVLHLLLSSLPSDDAVRTCVLARRWRHLWKSARAIRVAPRPGGDPDHSWTPRRLTRFVNHLLLLRGYSPAADECDIRCGDLDDDRDEDYYGYNAVSECRSSRRRDKDLSDAAGLWIRHAVSFCKCRALRISVRTGSTNRLCIPDVPFVSQSLRKVELADAKLTFDTLDFSRCPALEALDFSMCRIRLGRILSPSLRRLSMDECHLTGQTRPRISTPRLVSLHVTVCSGWAPFLDDMPMLVAADIRIQDDLSNDMCQGNAAWPCDEKTCYDCNHVRDGVSVLFQGLSSATDLELTSDPRVFIFRKDCQSCTTFKNLKTLLINEWCMTGDFGALVYFLRYTPILEKLTLQLEYCEDRLAVPVTDEKYSPKEEFLVSKQLNVVEIKCQKENELVGKILMILWTHGIHPEKINVESDFCPPCSKTFATLHHFYVFTRMVMRRMIHYMEIHGDGRKEIAVINLESLIFRDIISTSVIANKNAMVCEQGVCGTADTLLQGGSASVKRGDGTATRRVLASCDVGEAQCSLPQL